MECAAKGSGTACCGPPVRRCERCHAVAYCSLSHQVLHSSVHKSECKRLEQQMKRADILNEFPFTFTRGATQIQETGCSFLTRHGIHRLGMWMCECSCGVLANSSDDLRLINSWNLPSELCPCKGPSSPILDRLATWKDYHEWRGIPLNSPAALLLHWPLTIYWAIQLATLESLLPEISNELRIHYLGPEKELLQLAVFGELQALFPGVKVHIDFVGPSVSRLRFTKIVRQLSVGCLPIIIKQRDCFPEREARDGEKVELYTYAQCNNMECECKYSVEDHGDTTKTCQSCPITLRLHAGYYHDCYRKSLKGSPPHIIIAPNAGVGAYTSWLPTLELIKELKVAAVFSDYCEEASQLATRCISSVTGTSPKIQMQINPFRHPLAIEGSVLCVPCSSNCFLFGL